MNEYTHLAELYGFRCWFNENTNEVRGTNWFNDQMISIMSWIDVKFEINDGFCLKVIEKL